MKSSSDKVVFNIAGYIAVSVFAIVSILPFLLIISGSISSNESVLKYGYGLIPKEYSLLAYTTAFKEPMQILNAYKTSIIVTVCGTITLLFICSMAGYVLSRKDYRYRNAISFFFFFTTIFSGGLVPWYILCVQYLHFKEHPFVALIVPGIFGYFYTIIMRSYMSNIPDSISESAKIDGANDFLIYAALIIPMSKPVLATIGLFGALGYWNDWFHAMLFVNNEQYYPLQYFLYVALNTMQAVNRIQASAAISLQEIPTETFKLAMTIIATGPIILLYPLLQKYFIKGIIIGAVKG